ncbi:DUF2442 domain-containing protein [Candidatus Thiosymbion oneisti]|uniref:DUF2442 domain-containing protein n=1 Tax=Candidatus Thiosymbion oneisti TaxID=589554 RepID=UPI000B7C8608|nr:DUF2442 domain-containing protein [Candidatus Thiosymbion oneisti]
MLGVRSVCHHNGYVLFVELTNDKSGYFDVSPYLDKGIFVRLRDMDYLKIVKPDTFGIFWPEGQDFSADTIEHEIRNMKESCIDKVRGLVNSSRKILGMVLPDNKSWNMLCSSMDVVGDTDQAISEYVENQETGCLQLYGLLQAFFLQQDAIGSIAQVLGVDLPGHSKLKWIREIRNNAIGHPTNRGNGRSFHYISRASITKHKFAMLSHIAKEGSDKFIDVDIDRLIEDQRVGIDSQLEKIHYHLCQIENKNREEHRDIILVETFHSSLDYLLQKIYESCHSDDRIGQAKSHIPMIREMVEEFSKQAESRNELDEHTNYISGRCIYALDQLDRFYSEQSEFDGQVVEVYCTFLEIKLKELVDIAKEIDTQYQKDTS